MKPEILYEDPELLICHKPSGLLVIPDRFQPDLPCLHHMIMEAKGEKIWVVHRIDRDTSGLVCFAKNEASHRYLSGLWENREVEKRYLGLVHGRVHPSQGTIDKPIMEIAKGKGKMGVHPKGKSALTEYEVIHQWPTYAWVSFRILTGRSHQIRVHMQSLGHALVSDPLYGRPDPLFLSSFKKNYRPPSGEKTERPLVSRLGLHAAGLAFTMPEGKRIEVNAPLPKDLKAAITQLQKWQPHLPISS